MTDKIKELALEARIWSEKYAFMHKKYFSQNLDCMCSISSSYLSQQFFKHNIKHRIALYDNEEFGHCFLLFDNNTQLLDITASQFGKQYLPIEIKNIDSVEYEKTPFWQNNLTFDNCKDLLEYQIDCFWYNQHRIDRSDELMNQIFSYYNKKEYLREIKNKFK